MIAVHLFVSLGPHVNLVLSDAKTKFAVVDRGVGFLCIVKAGEWANKEGVHFPLLDGPVEGRLASHDGAPLEDTDVQIEVGRMLGLVELLAVFPDPWRATRSGTVEHFAHRPNGTCFLFRKDDAAGAIGEIDRHFWEESNLLHVFATKTTEALLCTAQKKGKEAHDWKNGWHWRNHFRRNL